jgi:hypothetical protein
MLSLENYPNYKEMEYIIDGTNVCWYKTNQFYRPVLRNLILLIRELISKEIKKCEIKIFCDASLRHTIDEPKKYEASLEKRLIIETPAGIQADNFILNYCFKHENTLIISNDLFKKYYTQLPDPKWILRKRVSFCIVNNEIFLVPMLN